MAHPAYAVLVALLSSALCLVACGDDDAPAVDGGPARTDAGPFDAGGRDGGITNPDSGSLDSGTADGGVDADGGVGADGGMIGDVDAGPGAAHPHEPVGFTEIASYSTAPIASEGFFVDLGSFSSFDDATAPASPPSTLRASYGAGFGGGSAPGKLEGPNAATHALYGHFWFRPSAGWVGHATATNKLAFFNISTSFAAVFLSMEGVGAGALPLSVRFQGTADPRQAGGGGIEGLLPNGGASAERNVVRGAWNEVELLFVLNDPGAANGHADVWLNGVQTTSYADVRWRDEACTWGTTDWYPIWGGTGGTLSAPQTMDLDHFYLSGM